MKPVRVVVIDRNDITRKGVEGIVSDAGDPFQVTAALVHLREVEACLKEEAVAVIILDDQTVHPSEVIRLATTCHQQYPDTGLIVLSQRRNQEYIQGVMRQGNASFILKNGDVQEQLLKALQLISSGYPFISPDAFKIMNSSSPPKLDSQDWDVLRLTEQGLRAKAIGAELGISQRTVYRVRDKLKEILGVNNNENLVDAARWKLTRSNSLLELKLSRCISGKKPGWQIRVTSDGLMYCADNLLCNIDCVSYCFAAQFIDFL
jgi:DNA-binding NarL/FixJ family response regulator